MEDDFTFKDLKKYLVKKDDRVSAASLDASGEMEQQRGLFAEDMEHYVHAPADDCLAPDQIASVLDGYVELLNEATRQVSISAPATELPYGETYNWRKIFKMRDP